MFDFLRKNIDVPFEKDGSHKFVPIIIGLMVFLATLALTCAITISSIIKEWDDSYAPGYVIEVPIKSYESRSGIDNIEKELMYALRTIIGADNVSLISNNYSVLGSESTDTQTPSSYLTFDITIRNGHTIEPAQIKEQVDKIRKDYKLVNHQTLRADKIIILNISMILSIVIAIIISLAAVSTIEFVTYSGLEVHKSIIDILHTLGARRQYIATQFQKQALILSLKGGMIGCGASAFLLFGLSFLLKQIDVEFVKNGIQNSQIVTIVFLTPLLGLLLSILAARVTVMLALNAQTKNC